VYLGDQKLPILYPRVRDQIRDIEVRLETYQRFQQRYYARGITTTDLWG